VLAVLVAAGVYMPKGKKASAAEGTTATPAAVAPQAPAQPAATAPPPAESKPAEVAPPAQETVPAAASANKFTTSNAAGGPTAADKARAAAAAAAAKAKAEELDRVEQEIDQLTGRSGAINSSLETLQRQQAASGYGMRGDIASKWSSMKLNLAKAQDAIGRNDVERAKRYAALAASDIEALERFLGR
jgi:hypothetical protein